ncbi:uncharacterized protein LOC111007565 isoform X2 [Momordica charantia]|uniref:Uncharacterized protein LOC111007565 isoform X2 n=1 Tax=Momordica charantia TaxID=3673 RepID=A0A6J1C5H6_MOMCH|nr:uncharacterized protein LOC111007565 isoform X2 [Momordica charantia]
MCSAGADAISCSIEFRCLDDDAWYNVAVKLEGDALRIMYCGFAVEHDNVFSANDFRSLSDLSDFEARFRPLSRQLQDCECRKVDPGMAVCASYSSRIDDVRFYDALVEGHGPKHGNLTIASIADMCQIQAGKINDTVLPTFFKRVREKIQARMNKGDSCQKDDCSPNLKPKLSFFQRMDQETRRAKRSCGTVEPCKDLQILSPRKGEAIEQDTDFGGMKHQYMILLENLDKGLSPVKLAKFLHGQTSILPRVYIFPTLSDESYARGAVVLNCGKNLDRLCGFLDNPHHVIVSSQGRPLVVTGKVARLDTFGTLAGAMVLDIDNKLCNENDGGVGVSVCSELKVVSVGTIDYSIAKQRKELFREFLSHQRRLHQRLALEESKIYCSAPLQYKL